MKNFIKATTIIILTAVIVFSVGFAGAKVQTKLDTQYNIYERISNFNANK